MLAGMYDTPNWELQGSQQGRWLSPDPAGAGWNLYAYATNPKSAIDPSGLAVQWYETNGTADSWMVATASDQALFGTAPNWGPVPGAPAGGPGFDPAGITNTVGAPFLRGLCEGAGAANACAR